MHICEMGRTTMLSNRKSLLLVLGGTAFAIALIIFFVIIRFARGDRLPTEARSAIEQREFEKALTLLDLYLRANPDDTEALLLASQSARRADSYARAAKLLRTFEQMGGSREEVLREERRVKAQSGDKQVMEELLRTSNQEPGDAGNFLNLEAIVKGILPFLEMIEASHGRMSEGPELQWVLHAVDVAAPDSNGHGRSSGGFLLER